MNGQTTAKLGSMKTKLIDVEKTHLMNLFYYSSCEGFILIDI